MPAEVMEAWNLSTAEQFVDSAYSRLMRKWVLAAWDDWKASDCYKRMQNTSFRAQFMNNYIIAHAKDDVSPGGPFTVKPLGGNHGFVFDNRVFVRPKFARQGKKSSNYPTKAAIEFHDQEKDLFGGIARLELLYCTNHLGTEVSEIFLSQRQFNKTKWLVPLRDSHELSINNLLQLPTQEQEQTAAQRIIKGLTSDGNAQGDSGEDRQDRTG